MGRVALCVQIGLACLFGVSLAMPARAQADRASISGPRDKDTYTVRSQPEDPGTMVIAVWDLDGTRLNPVVTVYDQNRRPVPVELLADDPGMYTLQVRHVRPRVLARGRTLLIRARSPDRAGAARADPPRGSEPLRRPSAR